MNRSQLSAPNLSRQPYYLAIPYWPGCEAAANAMQSAKEMLDTITAQQLMEQQREILDLQKEVKESLANQGQLLCQQEQLLQQQRHEFQQFMQHWQQEWHASCSRQPPPQHAVDPTEFADLRINAYERLRIHANAITELGQAATEIRTNVYQLKEELSLLQIEVLAPEPLTQPQRAQWQEQVRPSLAIPFMVMEAVEAEWLHPDDDVHNPGQWAKSGKKWPGVVRAVHDDDTYDVEFDNHRAGVQLRTPGSKINRLFRLAPPECQPPNGNLRTVEPPAADGHLRNSLQPPASVQPPAFEGQPQQPSASSAAAASSADRLQASGQAAACCSLLEAKGEETK